MENVELQIRTNSSVGSNETVNVFFYTETGEENFGDLQIKFLKNFIGYHVGYCSSEYTRFDKEPPSSKEKVWRVLKDGSRALKVWCNDVLVLHLLFAREGASCERTYENNVARVEFKLRNNKGDNSPWRVPDTASRSYRVNSSQGEKEGFIKPNISLKYRCFVNKACTSTRHYTHLHRTLNLCTGGNRSKGIISMN